MITVENHNDFGYVDVLESYTFLICLVVNLFHKSKQGLTIIIKSQYIITSACQNFGVHNVLGQILKTVQASYLLPSDFPNNFL